MTDQKLDRELLRKRFLPDGTPDEVEHFAQFCERLRLDPYARQVYAVRRGGKLTFMVAIDGFRLVADRTGNYAGQSGPEWCGEDGVWKDVWLSSKPPAAARVFVHRTGFVAPLPGTATWRSYAATGGMWQKLPDVMLAKCAEAIALRRAFPAELGGVYAPEEMDQADNPVHATAPATKVPRKALPARPRPAPEQVMREAVQQPVEAVVDRSDADDSPAEDEPLSKAHTAAEGLLVDLALIERVDLLHAWVDDVRRDAPEKDRAALWAAFKQRCADLGLDSKAAAQGVEQKVRKGGPMEAA